MELKKYQQEEFLRFKKATSRFLKAVDDFKIEKNETNEIIQKIVYLREEILEIKHASVIFLDFSEKLSLEIEKEKFQELDAEEMEKERVKIDTVSVESDMRKKLNQNFPKKDIDNSHIGFIFSHLAEVYADYYKYKAILDDIVFKKNSIQSDLLLTYLAGDFEGLRYHTFNHIDDLVSFENNELIYAKGLMSHASDFLEKIKNPTL